MVRQVFWCVKVQNSRSHFAEPDSRLLSFPWSAKTITWYYLYGFSRKPFVFVILVRVYRKKSSKLFWLGGWEFFSLEGRILLPSLSNRSGKRDVIRRGDQSFRHWAQAFPEAVLSLSWDDTGVHRWTSGTVVKPIPNGKGHWMVDGGRKSGELPSKDFMKTRRKSRYTTVHWCLPESVHQRTCHVVTRFASSKIRDLPLGPWACMSWLVHQKDEGELFLHQGCKPCKWRFQMMFRTFIQGDEMTYIQVLVPQLISWDRHSERLDHKEM